jgi:membrane peptidoglycan carboxypeptidase
MVTGVWMGYAEGGRTLDGLLNIGGRQLGPVAPPTVIWRDYMQKVLQDKSEEKFKDAYTPQTLSTGTTKPPRAPGDVTSAAGGADSVGGGGSPGSATPDSSVANSLPIPS